MDAERPSKKEPFRESLTKSSDDCLKDSRSSTASRLPNRHACSGLSRQIEINRDPLAGIFQGIVDKLQKSIIAPYPAHRRKEIGGRRRTELGRALWGRAFSPIILLSFLIGVWSGFRLGSVKDPTQCLAKPSGIDSPAMRLAKRRAEPEGIRSLGGGKGSCRATGRQERTLTAGGSTVNHRRLNRVESSVTVPGP